METKEQKERIRLESLRDLKSRGGKLTDKLSVQFGHAQRDVILPIGYFVHFRDGRVRLMQEYRLGKDYFYVELRQYDKDVEKFQIINDAVEYKNARQRPTFQPF